MGIIYTITLLLLIIIFILTPKSEKKLNIFSFISITIGLVFCYNVIICYILTFFTIPITLCTLSIINSVCALPFLVSILRKKKVQAYEMNKIDILYISILGLSILFVTYLNFGFPFHIKYETGDSAIHYVMAEQFSNSDSLLIRTNDPVYKNFATTKTISYVNSGLIMKCFQGVIDSYYNYNIFIGFDIFILLMTAIAMYTTISSFAVDKKTRFIAFAMSLIYAVGYPLNSMLFGFEYLSVSILLICLIFDMIYYFENIQIKKSYLLGMLFLLNFGLFNAYYMFVPFFYPAMWIYFCIKSYKENKNIFTKENIGFLVITLLIPFLLGYIYYMEPRIYAVIINGKLPLENELGEVSGYLLQKGFAVNGYIYVNFYTNMLLLLPIPIYLIVKKWEENKFQILTLAFCLLFILILLVSFNLKNVSAYYLSKNYFALWFILFYLNYKGIIEIYKNHSELSFMLVGVYILLIIMNLLFVQDEPKHVEYSTNENLSNVVEIFGVNKSIIMKHNTDLNNEELQILKYLKDNIDYNKKVEEIENPEQFFWTYSLTGYINDNEEVVTEEVSKAVGQRKLELKYISTIKNFKKADYIIYFYRAIPYKALKEQIFRQGEIIFENASGGIVKCNN